MATASQDTCKTTVTCSSIGTGEAVRPQVGRCGDKHDELVAPATGEAGAEEGGSEEKPIEDKEGEAIEVQEETADLKIAPAPVRPPAADV